MVRDHEHGARWGNSLRVSNRDFPEVASYGCPQGHAHGGVQDGPNPIERVHCVDGTGTVPAGSDAMAMLVLIKTGVRHIGWSPRAERCQTSRRGGVRRLRAADPGGVE